MKTKIKVDRLLLISKLEAVIDTRETEYTALVNEYEDAMSVIRKKILANLKKVAASGDLSGLELCNYNGVSIQTGVDVTLPEHPNRDYKYRYARPDDIRKKVALLKLSPDSTILVSTDDEYYHYL